MAVTLEGEKRRRASFALCAMRVYRELSPDALARLAVNYGWTE
jgi:hypothetical protein